MDQGVKLKVTVSTNCVKLELLGDLRILFIMIKSDIGKVI